MPITKHDEIFVSAVSEKLTDTMVQAMNDSSAFLAAIDLAKAKDARMELNPDPISRPGTYFDPGVNRIFIDPKDFVAFTNNPGGFVLRIAHELQHAISPGIPAAGNFLDPLSYTEARLREEAGSQLREYESLRDWKLLAGSNPYPPNARLCRFSAQLHQLKLN